MDDLLARYLDGELTEAEASALLRRLEDEPELAAALRDHEAIIAAGRNLPRWIPSPRLADRVMSRIEAPPQRTVRAATARWLAAAALAAGVTLGWLAAPGPKPFPMTAGGSATMEGIFVDAALPAFRGSAVRDVEAVRIDYVPTRSGVARVSIAGSFNGWDPERTPLQRRDGGWSILLLLPPGEHEYMIVEDGEQWVTDPSAPLVREDGFGGSNGVLEVRS